MSPDRDDEARHGRGNRAGSTSILLGSGYDTKDTNGDLEKATVGLALIAAPDQLATVMRELGVVADDLTGPNRRAWSILTEFAHSGVPGESVAMAFYDRAQQPEPGLTPKFQPTPGIWAQEAMSAVGKFGPGLPFAASMLAGRGGHPHRRGCRPANPEGMRARRHLRRCRAARDHRARVAEAHRGGRPASEDRTHARPTEARRLFRAGCAGSCAGDLGCWGLRAVAHG
ncbi:MAG TPA: hypothetical protein VIU87_21260 [Mycobacterium sp.]